MSSATMAILDQYVEDSTHTSCPPGKESWCSYNQDHATGQNTHNPMQNPSPKPVIQVVKPLFETLGSVRFLSSEQVVALKMLTNLVTIWNGSLPIKMCLLTKCAYKMCIIPSSSTL